MARPPYRLMLDTEWFRGMFRALWICSKAGRAALGPDSPFDALRLLRAG